MNIMPKLHKLNEVELRKVASNITYTNHAKTQLKERLGLDMGIGSDRVNVGFKIMNSKLAYVNTDNAINIAFSDHTYLVVSQDKLPKYVAITFKEPSHNSYTVKQKYELALNGVER